MLFWAGAFRLLPFPLSCNISRTSISPAFKYELSVSNAALPTSYKICRPRPFARKPPLSRKHHSTGAFQAQSRFIKMADFKAILAASKYPAKAHARRVVEWMKKTNPNIGGVLYLEGQKTRMIEDNDEPMPFRFASSPTSLAPH